MKKIFLLAATALIAVSGLAQEKALKPYGFGNNWFIQAQGGASYMFSEYSRKASVGDLISPTAAISIGKHFSPYAGARIQFGGWEAKSYLQEADKTYKVNYVQASFDGLFNFTNIFSRFEQERSFNLYGIVGLGYARGFKKDNRPATNNLVPKVGLQADFRLTSALSLNVEGNANFMPEKFNARYGSDEFDIPVNLLVGVTYRFDKHGFETVDILDPAQLASLNDQINKQRAAIDQKDRQLSDLNAQLSKKLAEKPQVVVKEKLGDSEVVLNAVVVFRLGSANLEQNQDINIFNAAKYLKENPGVNVVVTGYADKSTGTAKINQALSEKRAKAVADILTGKYGIASSRITVEASGDREQPFDNDPWNRVVIFTVK